MQNLIADRVEFGKVLLLVADAASHMEKATEGLSMNCSKLYAVRV
jgi:hypothetical protein